MGLIDAVRKWKAIKKTRWRSLHANVIVPMSKDYVQGTHNLKNKMSAEAANNNQSSTLVLLQCHFLSFLTSHKLQTL